MRYCRGVFLLVNDFKSLFGHHYPFLPLLRMCNAVKWKKNTFKGELFKVNYKNLFRLIVFKP